MGCASQDGLLSMRFGIDYEKIPDSERQKVEDMGKVLDEYVKNNENLETQNKFKDIQIENRDVIIDEHSLKAMERKEKKRNWITGFFIFLGTLGGLGVGYGVGKATK